MTFFSTRTKRARIVLAVAALLAARLTSAVADEAVQKNGDTKTAMVELTFPPETELRVLIDYVSQRLGVKFLYDEQVVNKRISIRAAEPVPADTLLNVLESALKMKGLALVEGDLPGWKRIVAAGDLAQIAVQEGEESLGNISGATAVTQTFSLTHIAPEAVTPLITPFLTKQGANTIMLPEKNMLVVTDYADNLRRIAQLIGRIDQAGPQRVLKLYEVQHVEAASLAQQISQSLAARGPAEGNAKPLEVSPDSRTNQLMLLGTQSQIDQALQLARSLDVHLGQRTQAYSFRHIEAERIDRFVKELFDPITIKRLYRSAVDQNDNLLIVTATEPIHERIVWLQSEMDVETKRPGSAVKFYHIKYANAQDILNTLRAIEHPTGAKAANNSRRGVSPLGRAAGEAVSDTTNELAQVVPGANTPAQPGGPPPMPPAQQAVGVQASSSQSATSETSSSSSTSLVAGAARLSVDPNSNSIIVIADRGVQQIYADLIERLDRRRPQVMIEAKVVILDTSDDFSLGIEIGGNHSLGTSKLMQFTSFGLSAVDPVTGALALAPGRAFNWALVDPKSADAVIRSLSAHKRAKVLSSPRILVNDNATGTLASVTEVPFTSVNASTTVATTSFAGFAEAGTTIEATPRVSLDGYLQLDFSISLNSFTGPGGNGVPPPRQTDQVTSSATVPDGYTVIVGGLTRRNESEAHEGIPFLEKIPVIKLLTSIRTESKSQTTLFVFLRPVVLQDDKFRDLKFLSDEDLSCSTQPGNFPEAAPLLVK